MRLYPFLVTFFLVACTRQVSVVQEVEITAPQSTSNENSFSPPKLMVGIVVDQMRVDYLYRFAGDFTDNGFKRLLGEGFFCADHHFTYAPTYTGPGHASVYTGTTPAMHGIISNDWFDKQGGHMVYCAQDTSVSGVGTEKKGGKMSPHRLLTTTITDQLRVHTNFRGKVIGVSMKDRGSILPAGHFPTGAYWFMGGDEGVWATSTYYTQQLPAWVTEHNALRKADGYLAQGWSLLLPEERYDESYADNNPYEAPYPGQVRPVFPYTFPTIEKDRYDYIKSSPHGNSMTIDFAIAAIEGEELGKDNVTDFLAMSFSSTDYIGHQFGPQSREVQDCYLRLDLELARFIDYLDATIGRNNYTLFLTADHGGADVPAYLQKFNMPAGYWKPQSMLDDVNTLLKKEYGDGQWVLQYVNDQFFLNHALIEEKEVDLEDICADIVAVAKKQKQVYDAMPTAELLENDFSEKPWNIIKRGIHPQRSGDVLVVTMPGFIENGYTGTTHGSPFTYDTHVPLIFFGKHITPGKTERKTAIRDIAPTVARLLRVPQPSGTTGSPIIEVLQ